MLLTPDLLETWIAQALVDALDHTRHRAARQDNAFLVFWLMLQSRCNTLPRYELHVGLPMRLLLTPDESAALKRGYTEKLWLAIQANRNPGKCYPEHPEWQFYEEGPHPAQQQHKHMWRTMGLAYELFRTHTATGGKELCQKFLAVRPRTWRGRDRARLRHICRQPPRTQPLVLWIPHQTPRDALKNRLVPSHAVIERRKLPQKKTSPPAPSTPSAAPANDLPEPSTPL